MVTCNSYLSQTIAVHDHTSVSQYKIDFFHARIQLLLWATQVIISYQVLCSSQILKSTATSYIVIIHVAAITVVALAQQCR